MKRFTLSKNEHFTIHEEIAHAISHGIGAALGIAALVLLILRADSTEGFVAALIFGISIISLYMMSTLYHAMKRGTKVKALFEKFDHIFIYFLIGGTFAPALLLVVPDPWGYIFLGLQWSIIAIAVTLKTLFFERFHNLHVIAYLILGWSAVFILQPLWQASPLALLWILLGGLAYSIGVFFYALRTVKYMHLVWHLFVLTGTVFHFTAIYFYIY